MALAAGSFPAFRDYATPVGVVVGYFIGRWVDPDLDQMGTTQAEGRMVNEIPLLGNVFYGYWSIYGSAFRRMHRSFWTHFPGVSTAIRVVFMFWWLPVVMKDWPLGVIYSVLMGMLGVFMGLSLADGLHWAADSLSGELRR